MTVERIAIKKAQSPWLLYQCCTNQFIHVTSEPSIHVNKLIPWLIYKSKLAIYYGALSSKADPSEEMWYFHHESG